MTISANKKIIVVSILFFAVLTACATAPTQEMSDARQALQAAHDAGAVKYAPDSLRDAEDTLGKAETALEKRAFKAARADANLARNKAMMAHDMALAIGAAKTAIAAAAAQGEHVSDAEDLLDKAQKAAQSGKQASAIKMAVEAKQLVER